MTRPFDHFVMFAAMRTGSNLLEANLNALPGVACLGEAFNPNFIGRLKQEEFLGWDLAARDADPLGFLARMRAETPGLSGFRYFQDHELRVFQPLIEDARCAKIVLTRNPLDSYVSWRTAQATGQWKLTNVARLRSARVRFDGDDFAAFADRLQAFHLRILNGLQRTGQTAFWLDYDDLGDVAVLNGLAAWLGVEARLEATDQTLKKQNPGAVLDRVENPEDVAPALARLDRFNLARTPSFEPRRTANLPGWVMAGPLLHMPVAGGPRAAIEAWMATLGPVSSGSDGRALARWRRAPGPHLTFAVLRHPLLRAQAVLQDQLMGGEMQAVRKGLKRVLKIDLPDRMPDDAEARRALLLQYLRFARMMLSGQTGLHVPAAIATQAAVVQGFAAQQSPDLILREHALADGLGLALRMVGRAAPPPVLPPPPAAPRDAEVLEALRGAYDRDLTLFGFDPDPGG